MTINLPENLEASIREEVDSGHYASIDEAMAEAARLLLRQLKQQRETDTLLASQELPDNVQKPIWEIIEEENRSIPPEVWDDLPTDLSAQHDHYIYGTPKQPDA
jgi:Arc/MetJ-type ribon-helix-helix transcriptional regulator